jgi:hypothetical protein
MMAQREQGGNDHVGVDAMGAPQQLDRHGQPDARSRRRGSVAAAAANRQEMNGREIWVMLISCEVLCVYICVGFHPLL